MPKIVLIGAGSIGIRHLKNLLKLGYQSLAVSDTDGARLIALKNLGEFPLYHDAKGALSKEKPDIVFICTPAHTHISLAHLALDVGAHVFIEKPLSSRLHGVSKLIRLSQAKKKLVFVACNYRFHKGFLALQKALKSKRYGNPLVCRTAVGYYLPDARKQGNFRSTYVSKKVQGGGALLDSGSHVVEYLSALLGDIKKRHSLKGKSASLGLGCEESAVLICEHTSGVISSITLDFVSRRPIHRVEVVTDKGLLSLDFKEDALLFETEDRKDLLYQGDKDDNQMFIDEISHFLNAVQRRQFSLEHVQRAADVLKVLLLSQK